MIPDSHKSTIRNLILKGADIYLSHHCDTYNEFLTFHNTSILKDGTISGFTQYVSPNPAYSLNGQNYLIYHNHTLENTLTLVRTNHISGEGKFGGLFGLPNCNILRQWEHSNQRWTFHDRWVQCKSNIEDIIAGRTPIKVRIRFPEYTAIAETAVVISHDNGELSVRTSLVGIPTQNGVDITRFSINDGRIIRRTWHVSEIPTRYTKAWLYEKMRDLTFQKRWRISNDILEIGNDVKYDILKLSESKSEKHYW